MRLLFDYIRYNRRRVILGGYGGVAPSEKKHRTPSSERLHTRHSRPDFCGFHALGNGWVTKSNSRLGGCPSPWSSAPACPCLARVALRPAPRITLCISRSSRAMRMTSHSQQLQLTSVTTLQTRLLHHVRHTSAARCAEHNRKHAYLTNHAKLLLVIEHRLAQATGVRRQLFAARLRLRLISLRLLRRLLRGLPSL